MSQKTQPTVFGNSAVRLLLLWIVICISTLPACAQRVFSEYDLTINSRPKLPVPPSTKSYSDGLVELWSKALQRPDPELQRFTINSIAIAHQRQIKNLGSLKEKVIELLNAPGQTQDVVTAAASTLIAMDAQNQSTNLAKVAKTRGDAVRRLVEPALVNWKSPALKADWLARLKDPDAGKPMIDFAINGLAAIGAKESLADLTQIMSDPRADISVRINAAAAIGQIGSPNVLKQANALLDSEATPDPIKSVMAVSLLQRESGKPTTDLLIKLVDHSSTVVQAKALEQLFRIDKSTVAQLAAERLGSNDVNVRRWYLRALLSKPVAERVAIITPSLDDANPKLRRGVTKGLTIWARDPKLKPIVIAETTKILENDSWRGCEQATVVLAKLNHKQSGPRMVELLSHDRDEVQVASAWGLVQLRDKQRLPAMLEHAKKVYRKFKSGKLSEEEGAASEQMAHLFTAFGDQNYRAAEPVIRAYLPKNLGWGTNSRAAACWAAGLIFAKDPPQDLIDLLLERLHDTESLESETPSFRVQCAVAFARMKAESTMKDLREYAVGQGQTAIACYWAIEQMTGEKPPALVPIDRRIDDWFLSPLPNDS